MTALPPTFLLFIRNRAVTSTGKYRGFVLVDSAYNSDTGSWTLTPRPKSISTTCTIQRPSHATIHTNPSTWLFRDTMMETPCRFRRANGTFSAPRRVSNLFVGPGMPHLNAMMKIHGATETPIPIMEISVLTGIFSATVHPNCVILYTIHGPPAPAPAPAPSPVRSSNRGSLPPLTPFVAKKLLALARLNKETCPITLEEFNENHAAVLPCGHLFVTFAIEETLKMTAAALTASGTSCRCPTCRTNGVPVFC